jgi:hypothetical protein
MKAFPMNQLAGAELTNWQSYEECGIAISDFDTATGMAELIVRQ